MGVLTAACQPILLSFNAGSYAVSEQAAVYREPRRLLAYMIGSLGVAELSAAGWSASADGHRLRSKFSGLTM